MVAQLAEIFRQTLAPQRDLIAQAEAQLKQLSAQHGFSVAVLQLLATPELDEATKQAAGVNFKNLVKYRWVPTEADSYSGVKPLQDDEKAQIKAQLPQLLLATPPLVRAQLSEALALICNHDFPKAWPNLLPELVARLATAAGGNDLPTVQGVLVTANSIFKRYRNQYRSDGMVAELAVSQDAFAPTLLETQKHLSAQFAAAQDPAVQKLVLQCVRLSFRIFFSFNAPGVTPLMEGQLEAWMDAFHTFLVLPDVPALAEKDKDKESVPDAVRCAVCHNINLYMEQSEEDFAKYLKTFVAAVWGLLLKVSPASGQDNLAMAGIRFLTTIAKSFYCTLFTEQNALQQVCESIVVPNLRVRADDEEVFDMNPVEYIRRDSEGSDSDTRRRAAADLVKALVEKFPQEVTGLCTGYVQAMLAEYAASPSTAWKAKDCAIYLVLALTVRGKTATHGATSTNQLVNVQDFFGSQVLPELQSSNLEALPMLKADAIKFVTTFRSLLPKEALLAALPSLVKLLTCSSYVVHSYAATCVERMLAIKDGGAPRFTAADLQQHLAELLSNLFAGFKLPESAENEYLMRAVTRVIGFVGPAISPAAPQALQALAGMLLEVCKNPRNPGFNHYLFESVAALIRHAGASNPAMIDTFEQLLFPAFNHVLQQDVQEFHPYVFQIFAQLIELRSPPLPAVYLQIFPPLLAPQFWERSGNVPALVRLLQAYLSKAGGEVVAGGHLVQVLGVFQKLISSKAHDHEGFHILSAVVENVPQAAYDQYLPTIFTLLFTRLQNSRTHKFLTHFLTFLATLIVKLGPQAAAQALDKIQPGMTLMLMQQVWLPNMAQLAGSDEKLMLVATARCLSELPALQANSPLWSQLKDTAYKQLEASRTQVPGTDLGPIMGQGDDDFEPEEAAGYTAAYAQLANAARPARPVLAEIADPKQFMDASLAKVLGGAA